MRKTLATFVITILMLLVAAGAYAGPTLYTYDISYISKTADPAHSGLLGYSNWFQWLYRVDVIPGGSYHNGLSHFNVGLPDCYTSDILSVMATTAGANGVSPNTDNLSALDGDKYRTYSIVTGQDGSTGMWGMKWNDNETFDKLDAINEYDYFWFSAPTDEAGSTEGLVKYGTYTLSEYVDSPACPGCEQPKVPEPASLSLLGLGLIGFLGRKRT